MSAGAKIVSINKKLRDKLYLNTSIQIADNKRVLVENCKHILECNEVMVKVVTADFTVEIWGENLTISDYNTYNAVVNGKISSVSLEPRAKSRRESDENDF